MALARRLKDRHGRDTRHGLLTFEGTAPGSQLDLGRFGVFQLEHYTREPLRCYKCQRYGHVRSSCGDRETCAICAGRHSTDVCLDRHKRGQQTRPRCANCNARHHAWNTACPKRKEILHST